MDKYFLNIRRFILLYNIFIRRVRLKGHTQMLKYAFKRLFLRQEIPMTIMIALTYRCQCRCVHCSASDLSDQAGEELTTAECRDVIREASERGFIKVGITGGEPLLRDDIVEIVHFAYRTGMSVSIDTNGILLTEQMVRELKDAGITNINVSLDHPDEKYHNRLRRYKNCFKHALEGIDHCVQQRIPCVVSTYITDRSFENNELDKMIALAKELKSTAVRCLFPIHSGKFSQKKRSLLSPVNKQKFFDTYADGSFVYSESPMFDFQTGQLECSALKKLSVYLTAYGDLKYCHVSNNVLGNIRSESLSEILNRNEYSSPENRIKLNCQTFHDQ
ncbi:MAG: radical SAM protein [Candidatus Omnitrophica bacterium]|nr:radical SAM protein [Candidatus Omnitrophota bacterium]